MAAAKKPFKLAGDTAAQDTTRDVKGRFARPDAVPANPLGERKPASNDQQVMSGWAPFIGQGSAKLRGQENPYPDVPKEASTRSSFKLNQ